MKTNKMTARALLKELRRNMNDKQIKQFLNNLYKTNLKRLNND